MNKYGIGAILSYRDFEEMKAKKRKKSFCLLVAILSFLIALFLFKNAFALYGTTYLPNGQKAYKNMDTGQVIAPCEYKCD